MTHRWGNTSRHARGYDHRWDKLRISILKRDQYLCVPCKAKGRTAAATSVDHIKPKASGGTDDPSNLQSICGPCHRAKSAREAAEAQGRTYRPKARIGHDGWPLDG